MRRYLSRRSFGIVCGSVVASSAGTVISQEPKDPASPPPSGPTEASFERDYDAPSFKPSWKKHQVSRLMGQDFVIFAHSDLEMVRKLLDREPGLLNASIDWGGGDWETGLGGAAHMGRKDIVELLLARGARIDLFAATMLGQLDAVRSFLTLQPGLIDAKGPHGFSLHFHAQVGGEAAKPTLDYLQSIKQLELKPIPFLKK
jgi:hypothetical protein